MLQEKFQPITFRWKINYFASWKCCRCQNSSALGCFAIKQPASCVLFPTLCSNVFFLLPLWAVSLPGKTWGNKNLHCRFFYLHTWRDLSRNWWWRVLAVYASGWNTPCQSQQPCCEPSTFSPASRPPFPGSCRDVWLMVFRCKQSPRTHIDFPFLLSAELSAFLSYQVYFLIQPFVILSLPLWSWRKKISGLEATPWLIPTITATRKNS